MGGIRLSVAEVLGWDAAAVRRVFHIGRSRADAAFDAASGLAALGIFDSWGGDTAAAARAALSRTRLDLDDHGNEAIAVAYAARNAADGIEAVQKKLCDLITEAEDDELRINRTTSRVELGDTVTNPTRALVDLLDLQPRLDAALVEADQVDDALANAVDMSDGDAPIPVIAGPPGNAEARLQNEINAFTQVFHRLPASSADWETAAALDPVSYEPKNRGVPANIVVGRIAPVPGQGVVRANLFIPSESVRDPKLLPPWKVHDDAGDQRGFDAAAGPEQSRVSVLVDYENGVVIGRQNPSLDLTTGKVRAGHPAVRVAQRPDGSVYVDYKAANPFSPGGETLAKAIVCVDGQLVVQPGGDHPRVGGLVTSFPALEVYHDAPAGNGLDRTSTTTVTRMWPFRTDQWGPVHGLTDITEIGDWRRLEPFLPPSADAYPRAGIATDLGPPSDPPTAVVLR